MNHRPSREDTPDSERYLRDTADSFFFDLGSGIYKPKAYQGQTKRDQETHVGPPSWQFWVTTIVSTLTLIAVAIYAYYAAGQLETMNNTYGEIKKQTVFQRQQTVGTYAATIPKASPWPQTIPNDLDLLNYQGIGLAYVNVGKIRATDFIADATMTRESLPSYRPLGVPEHAQSRKVQILPNDRVNAQGSGDAAQIRFNTKALTARDIDLLTNLGETIEINGWLQYGNGFGDTVREPFCFLYAVTPQHIFPSGAATGGPRGGWATCEDGKFVIAQSLKWKQKPNSPVTAISKMTHNSRVPQTSTLRLGLSFGAETGGSEQTSPWVSRYWNRGAEGATPHPWILLG